MVASETKENRDKMGLDHPYWETWLILWVTGDDPLFIKIFVKKYFKLHLIFRVLLFPPLSRHHRLLIHKSVESDFPVLITFSIGAQETRQTVVAFREACERYNHYINIFNSLYQVIQKKNCPIYIIILYILYLRLIIHEMLCDLNYILSTYWSINNKFSSKKYLIKL